MAGEEIDLDVTGLATEGDAVGRYDGFAVFVPGGVPGDRLRVRVTEVKSRFARGEVVAVLAPGPGRADPVCSIFGACGGCQWQHVAYPEQLARKRQAVADALERVGRLRDVPVAPTLGMDDPLRYRNKAAVPFGMEGGRVVAGFYRRDSHRIVDLPPDRDAAGCGIQHPTINRVIAAVRSLVEERGVPVYDETDGRGLLRHLVARVGVRTGEALAVLVLNREALPDERGFAAALMERVPALVGVGKNINTGRTNVIFGPRTAVIAGRDHLFEELGGLRFKVSALSFFQVNPAQAERLYGLALDAAELRPADMAVDAYCGAGALALLAARRCRRVYGIEEVPAAVADARENARLNGIDNARFLLGRVEDLLRGISYGGRGPDAVFLDPPRKGCEPVALEACLALAPRRIVYVSCNPATLARDLAVLADRYHVEGVQPVDLFPQTAHVEAVASLRVRK